MTNAITTKLSTNSGTVTTDGTEQTLGSTTAISGGATLVLHIDTTNMVDGDVIEIRHYLGKNGGSDIQTDFASFANAQGDKLKRCPVLDVHANGRAKFTIKRVAGTDRSYDWWVTELGA